MGEWVSDILSHLLGVDGDGGWGKGGGVRGEGKGEARGRGRGEGVRGRVTSLLLISIFYAPCLYIFCLMCAYMYLYDQQLIQKCQTGLQSLYIML